MSIEYLHRYRRKYERSNSQLATDQNRRLELPFRGKCTSERIEDQCSTIVNDLRSNVNSQLNREEFVLDALKPAD